jgi:hypothetical protein
MMLVDMEVAAGLDHEVEEAMACETLKHMVEERHAGLDRAAAAAVEVERYLYLGLARLAFDRGRAGGKLLAADARGRLAAASNLKTRSF